MVAKREKYDHYSYKLSWRRTIGFALITRWDTDTGTFHKNLCANEQYVFAPESGNWLHRW
jgi:hypothetical protein